MGNARNAVTKDVTSLFMIASLSGGNSDLNCAHKPRTLCSVYVCTGTASKIGPQNLILSSTWVYKYLVLFKLLIQCDLYFQLLCHDAIYVHDLRALKYEIWTSICIWCICKTWYFIFHTVFCKIHGPNLQIVLLWFFCSRELVVSILRRWDCSRQVLHLFWIWFVVCFCLLLFKTLNFGLLLYKCYIGICSQVLTVCLVKALYRLMDDEEWKLLK